MQSQFRHSLLICLCDKHCNAQVLPIELCITLVQILINVPHGILTWSEDTNLTALQKRSSSTTYKVSMWLKFNKDTVRQSSMFDSKTCAFSDLWSWLSSLITENLDTWKQWFMKERHRALDTWRQYNKGPHCDWPVNSDGLSKWIYCAQRNYKFWFFTHILAADSWDGPCDRNQRRNINSLYYSLKTCNPLICLPDCLVIVIPGHGITNSSEVLSFKAIKPGGKPNHTPKGKV